MELIILEVCFQKSLNKWHPNNPGTPFDYRCGSNVEMLWVCDKCPSGDPMCHTWPAKISQRTSRRVEGYSGCPYCADPGGTSKRCPHAETLASKYPELVKEWSPNNPLSANLYTPYSGYRAEWICATPKCGVPGCHKWIIDIRARTNGRGCSYCCGKKACPHTSLAASFPEMIMKEWDFEKNTRDPNTVTRGTDKKYFWKCLNPKCATTSYPQSVGHRTLRNGGCPDCSSSIGEKFITKILTSWNILFVQEYRVVETGQRRYDFKIDLLINGITYGIIIEYDGRQHFKRNCGFSKSLEKFKYYRMKDIYKHLIAISSKYRYKVLRIDYKNKTKEDIQQHINIGFAGSNFSYYSSLKLYSWIIEAEKEFWSRSVGLNWENELMLCQEIATKHSELYTE